MSDPTAVSVIAQTVGDIMRRALEMGGRPWTADHDIEIRVLATNLEKMKEESAQAALLAVRSEQLLFRQGLQEMRDAIASELAALRKESKAPTPDPGTDTGSSVSVPDIDYIEE